MKKAIIVASFLAALLITSCDRKTECKATIVCHNQAGQPEEGTKVELFANTKGPGGGTFVADLKAQGITDSNGEVSFIFKLPAIYDVRATKTVGSSSLEGIGMIKLEEGKGVTETVDIK